MATISNQKYYIDLIIDSKYRTSYSSTNSNNFEILIPTKISGQILRYGIKSCMIPNTINNISGSFEITDSSGINTVTLTSGNYTTDTLRSELEDKLNLLGVDTYTVTFSGNKYTITSSFSGFVINPNNQVNSNGILFKIGFGISGIYVSNAGVLTSYAGVNLSYPDYIFVDIGQLAKHIKNTNGLFHNFIIPNCKSYGGIISFNPQSNFVQEFLPYTNIPQFNTSKFNVKLTYENGELIDLNNSDWIIVLNLEVLSNYVI